MSIIEIRKLGEEPIADDAAPTVMPEDIPKEESKVEATIKEEDEINNIQDIVKEANDYAEHLKAEKHGYYIETEEALEKLLLASDLNMGLVWMAATMATIAAINSLSGATVLVKGLLFLCVGLGSLIMYRRRFNK